MALVEASREVRGIGPSVAQVNRTSLRLQRTWLRLKDVLGDSRRFELDEIKALAQPFGGWKNHFEVTSEWQLIFAVNLLAADGFLRVEEGVNGQIYHVVKMTDIRTMQTLVKAKTTDEIRLPRYLWSLAEKLYQETRGEDFNLVELCAEINRRSSLRQVFGLTLKVLRPYVSLLKKNKVIAVSVCGGQDGDTYTWLRNFEPGGETFTCGYGGKSPVVKVTESAVQKRSNQPFVSSSVEMIDPDPFLVRFLRRLVRFVGFDEFRLKEDDLKALFSGKYDNVGVNFITFRAYVSMAVRKGCILWRFSGYKNGRIYKVNPLVRLTEPEAKLVKTNTVISDCGYGDRYAFVLRRLFEYVGGLSFRTNQITAEWLECFGLEYSNFNNYLIRFREDLCLEVIENRKGRSRHVYRWTTGVRRFGLVLPKNFADVSNLIQIDEIDTDDLGVPARFVEKLWFVTKNGHVFTFDWLKLVTNDVEERFGLKEPTMRNYIHKMVAAGYLESERDQSQGWKVACYRWTDKVSNFDWVLPDNPWVLLKPESVERVTADELALTAIETEQLRNLQARFSASGMTNRVNDSMFQRVLEGDRSYFGERVEALGLWRMVGEGPRGNIYEVDVQKLMSFQG
ncbi:TPA: hypothetical protein DF272_00620 [Candidatus Falkowbacteria bacterium]|nr:hypothetical protein [Candidatus Falkowbacteria bacterium]